MSAMPDWLVRHIADTTGIAPGERDARPGRCRTCGERVLSGLSDDILAFTVRVDPTPLGPLGEALALMSGRRTYGLRRHGQRPRLHQRDRWQIGGNPHWVQDVVADHACGSTLPAVASVLAPVSHHLGGPDDQPPF